MKSARILLMTLMSLIFSVGVVRVCWSAVDRGAIQGTVTDAQGAVVPIGQLEELAARWYGDRIDPDWRPRTAEASQAILADVGLTGEFWRLP